MAAPIIAGLLTGCGIYYVSRLAPRIAQRAAAAQGTAAFATVYPYHSFEYGFQKSMTEKEAYMLLGFDNGQANALINRPAEEEVKKRYRSLMMELHSDVSGTPYVATKLNQAKDLLTR